MERLKKLSDQRISDISLQYKRYLYDTINWDNHLIIIKGPKGVGKTTLMLQHIRETFADLRSVIYVNLDHIWFTTHNLLDFVEYYQARGVTHFFFDEVHKYPSWSQELKNIYDYYPKLHLVASGSSLLKLQVESADLSRRKREYELLGLSFREYLEFEGIATLPVLTLEDILSRHEQIAAEINSKFKVLPYFFDYLRKGYYAFYKEAGDGYELRVQAAVEETINVDIPAVSVLEYSSVYKLKQLLSVLSDENPYTVNLKDLGQKLNTTRNTVLKALDLLDKGAIIRKVYSKDRGMGKLVKPEKILFDNTNIIYSLASGKVGTVRETFFAAQMAKFYTVSIPSQGDFLVDGKWLFEVGGKKKSFKQIKDIDQSYVVSDEIESGVYNRLPLWIFGLMY